MLRLLLATVLATWATGAGAIFAQTVSPEGTKLLRFPDLHGDEVVFTYAGDLWLAPASPLDPPGTTGTARRLTSHPGLELFAKFSPDGRWIAFTGQYDGDEQVYVVAAEGGVPRQLTFYPATGPLPARWGYDNQVLGWSPDGARVLFRSLRDSWGFSDSRLYTVGLDGRLPVVLPVPQSGGAAFADNDHIVYTPQTRDFRSWKRYEGGWAQDLYLFDLTRRTSVRLTDHARADRDPMWIDGRLYFASDREGTVNLYSLETQALETQALETQALTTPALETPALAKSGAVNRLTHSVDWDLRWPSADEARRIVYERHGELEIFDTRTGAVSPLTIRVPAEALALRSERTSVSRLIESFGLSPHGKRALFVARGDVFTAPIDEGVTRNLTRSSGAHDRAAVWSGDGRWIYFVSDLSGEDEIYRIDQSGLGAPEPLTDLAGNGQQGRLDDLALSPGGAHLAFHDQRGRLYVLEVTRLGVRDLVQVADDVAPRGIRGRLVAERRPSGLYAHRAERPALDPRLERRRLDQSSGQRSVVERLLARLGRRWRLPLLPLRPAGGATGRLLRAQLRAEPRHRGLRPRPARRRAPSVSGQKRRGGRGGEDGKAGREGSS